MKTRKCQSCPADAAPGRARCEACLAKDRERYRTKYRERRKARHLASEYKLTLAQRARMEKKQRGKCASCGEEGPLYVDHHHDTRIVRGLLCHGCNTAAGLLDECPSRAFKLGAYLRRHFNDSISPALAEMAWAENGAA